MPVVDMVGRLALAAFCSSLVGFEREAAHKAAGLRTHTLVGVGAAIFSIISLVGFAAVDPSRIAAQIVTGVGFLGAGAIFRDGASVSGLTTAAGLWAVAAIGMAAGSGSYALAFISTIVILIVLYAFRAADAALARRTAIVKERLKIVLSEAAEVGGVVKFCRKVDPSIEQLEFHRLEGTRGQVTVSVMPDKVDMIAEMVAGHRDVESVER